MTALVNVNIMYTHMRYFKISHSYNPDFYFVSNRGKLYECKDIFILCRLIRIVVQFLYKAMLSLSQHLCYLLNVIRKSLSVFLRNNLFKKIEVYIFSRSSLRYYFRWQRRLYLRGIIR